MKHLILLIFSGGSLFCNAQDCGAVQQLNSQQNTDLSPYVTLLDTALKHEDFPAVDSLNARILEIFGAEAGIPDGAENYYTLTSNTNWLLLPDAVMLSRALIDQDTTFYSELWKLAKGMLPPNDDPHAIFLRTAAETAAGLFKIAEKETDTFRQNRYRFWANRALDSLATMQLASGAFPFPDLRDYNDPTFSPIIQNFLLSCGDDSVNVLQNGWIIDDKGTGEFKFDAGVIAEAFYDAFVYTGNTAYRDMVIRIADYMLPLHLNRNYNYNTFSAMALTRALMLTGDWGYEDRASKNLRYGLLPGQAENGRWVDGHNANARYHNLIITNCTPFMQFLPITNPNWPAISQMYSEAVINLTKKTFECESATGFQWIVKAYTSSILPLSTKDSMEVLIGRYINQAAINGKYLNVAVLGNYFELLDYTNSIEGEVKNTVYVWPNPATNQLSVASESTNHLPQLIALDGSVFTTLEWEQQGEVITTDVTAIPAGFYLLHLLVNEKSTYRKIQIIH